MCRCCRERENVIKIEKTGKREVRVVFDVAGAKELEAAFAAERRAIHVRADSRLWKGRSTRQRAFRDATLLVVDDEERDMLIAELDRLTLRLDAESINTIAARLRMAHLQGFFPAEMAEVTLGEHGTELVTLYGDLNAA